MDGECWLVGKHGRDQESVTIQVQSHFKLPKQFNVLLAMSLREHIPLKDVGENSSPEYTSLRTYEKNFE